MNISGCLTPRSDHRSLCVSHFIKLYWNRELFSQVRHSQSLDTRNICKYKKYLFSRVKSILPSLEAKQTRQK